MVGTVPPCPPYDVIVTVKVALLCPLWATPPLPTDLGRPFWMAPKEKCKQHSIQFILKTCHQTTLQGRCMSILQKGQYHLQQ